MISEVISILDHVTVLPFSLRLTLCKLCDFGHDQFYMKKDLCNPHKSFFLWPSSAEIIGIREDMVPETFTKQSCRLSFLKTGCQRHKIAC